MMVTMVMTTMTHSNNVSEHNADEGLVVLITHDRSNNSTSSRVFSLVAVASGRGVDGDGGGDGGGDGWWKPLWRSQLWTSLWLT